MMSKMGLQQNLRAQEQGALLKAHALVNILVWKRIIWPWDCVLYHKISWASPGNS